MSNTLLSPALILAWAMRVVRNMTPRGSEPFEINAETRFLTTALTLRIDEFSEAYIKPAIAAAMEQRHAFTGPPQFVKPFGCDISEVAYSFLWGVSGRLVRTYDIHNDIMRAQIDVRVFSDETETAPPCL
jgi:hypothetical protein